MVRMKELGSKRKRGLTEEAASAHGAGDELVPVPATYAKVNFGDILHQASVEGKRFLVNRQGKPVAVVLSYRDYRELVAGNK